ncbi:MAG: MarR family transcriptional regulator [Chitinophaga sp.]|jgi:MarR family transcriptional regulator, organic hydroperoxide resistance regulator|nr:MarR family transcriptional regulator [Chitinophaga sp.]
MKNSESKYCNCLYFNAAALARKVEKMATESWKETGLAPSHAYLLLLILEEPGMQPGCIASHLQLSPSTITRLIEKLEEKKLVVRTTEGKLTNVYPTPKAKELLPQMKNCGQQFYKSCVDVLGKEENSKIVSALRSVADKLGD